MKKIKIRKLFLGHISIRDYIVEKAIENEEGIAVEHEGMKMVIPLEQLKHKFQFHTQRFQSHFSEKEYELIDFRFEEDK